MQRPKKFHFLSSVAPIAFPASMLAAAAFVGATPALADTTVSGSTLTPLLTSSAGNVTVSDTGSIRVNSGTAVTVDSSSNVTLSSAGTLTMGGVSGNAAIVVNPGVTTTITNGGTISVPEDYTPATLGNSTVVSGSVSQLSNRYGIHLLSGGTTAATITNSGTITLEGNTSGGIVADSDLTGSITNTGTITVKGDNSVGVKTGNVTGSLTIGGTVAVTGSGAQALVVNGNVSGAVTINGALSQAVSYTADDATTQVLSPTAISTGAAAAQISGNVAGGVIVTIASSTNNVTQTTGSIQSYGTSPALLVGGTGATTIGPVVATTGTYSVAIDGTVGATAYYSGLNARGVVLGGQGGTVALSNGIGVSGTVTATTVNSDATAILINQGVTATSLYNQGTIRATSSEVSNGNLYGIRDLSGSLTTINNTGYITVSGASTGTVAAIDVSANTTGVTINQSLTSANATNQATDKASSTYNVETATVYTGITGDIYTGSGNDTINIQSGKVTGNAYLGAGNNAVILADDAKWIGNVDFGTGSGSLTMGGNSRFTGQAQYNDQVGTLTINDSAIFRGTIAGGSQLGVVVNGGAFNATSAVSTTVHSLTVNSGGSLGVYINGTTGTASHLTTDAATFNSGSKIGVTISSFTKAEGNYNVLSAGTLTGASNVTSQTLTLPILFNGTITADGNDVYVNIARKTAAQLGLTSPQAAAYDAIIANAANYTDLQGSLLQMTTTSELQSQFNGLLPDYAGGGFDFVTRGSRQAAQHISDDSSLFTISNTGVWLEPMVFHATKHDTDSIGYSLTGGGVTLGLERTTAIGNVGVYFDWTTGNVKNNNDQSMHVSNIEFNAFWRKAFGRLYTFARVGYGRSSYRITRTFTGAVDSTAISYSATGNWKGNMLAASGGLSYEMPLSETFKVRPKVSIDAYRLKENGYQETGTDAIILLVDGRKSTAVNATTTLGFSWSGGASSYEGRPFTLEADFGRRNHVAGDLGSTTATFGSGSSFTLTPQNLQSAWVGSVGILQGGLDYTWKISAGAEKPQNGGLAYSLRASISIAL
ncbi:hypothetical protein NUTIK01_23850 [Novosphingobium sp. IK01]|uniref:Autotransporter domain-containing protein n=2 Tax=Novosphingobium pituita TaxID=3056842 RepID=A0ABQ6P8L8_9SPHN|nr:hypothetical protein NUTIK01_23850 [Novosphingobium sp. IK01]